MLYLIGLGLDEKGISLEGKEIASKADKIYLESYTVDFPYYFEDLEEVVGKVEKLGRQEVESDNLIEEAKEKDIVLLVYGSPLMATTHTSLILNCIENKVGWKVIHNSSIFDAITETGLQAYKFGKTASLPDWTKKGRSESFIEIIEQNQKIKAHTLLLVDIGLEFGDALKQLEEASEDKIKLKKIVVLSLAGTKKKKVFFDSIENLKNGNIEKPFCFVIPGEMHFLEEEFLKKVK